MLPCVLIVFMILLGVFINGLFYECFDTIFIQNKYKNILKKTIAFLFFYNFIKSIS